MSRRHSRALLSPVLVGRAHELAELGKALDAAGTGSGATFVLTGEAGIGKSRLMREIRRISAEQGVSTLAGRAVQTSAPIPFRPIAEALLAAHRCGRVGDDPSITPFRNVLGELVPDWFVGTPADRSGVSVLHIAEGFLRVARSCARAGGATLVVLDDLHWADSETLAVVEYLADNVSDEPVLLVVSARPEPASGPVRALVALAERRSATWLRLPRLSSYQEVELARGCLGDLEVPAEVRRLVADRADGNPFFVEELLAGLENDGALVRRGQQWLVHRPGARAPSAFAESVRRRFGSLARIDQDVLIGAALLGRRVDAELLALVSGCDRSLVDGALRAGSAGGLIETHGRRCRFRHALARDALLAELSPDDRATRAASALAGLCAARPGLEGGWIETAADLAELAGQHHLAVTHLLEGGRRALRSGALTSAESAHRRALALSRGTSLELDATEALVETLGSVGRAEDAFPLGEVLLAQLGEAEDTVDPHRARRRSVHFALARASVTGTDWPLATAHIDAVDALGGHDDLLSRARLDALRAEVALGERRLADAGRLAEAALGAAERSGDADLSCEALLVHGRCLRLTDLDAAATAFTRARIVAREAGLAHREARALAELGFLAAHRGGDTESLYEARRLARACGAFDTEAVAENALNTAAWSRGDPDAGLTHANAAVRLARRYRLGELMPATLVGLAAQHALRGDREAMDAVLAEAEPLIRGDTTELIAQHAQCRAVCAFAGDDLAEAASELASAGELARLGRPTIVPPMLGMAPILLALAGESPGDLIAVFRARNYHRDPRLAAMLAAAEAVHLARAGGLRAAEANMARALRAVTPNGFVPAVIARLVASAAAEQGWGDPVAWLGAALVTFEARKLPAPAQACRTALRRFGRPTPRGEDMLTARERDVLTLIARGLPNREMAERLFLSPRTVEKHVERLLAKTGSANRSQLATYVLRRDAVVHADS
jgi:DNA-binding NarL/FixJ family response regulator